MLKFFLGLTLTFFALTAWATNPCDDDQGDKDSPEISTCIPDHGDWKNYIAVCSVGAWGDEVAYEGTGKLRWIALSRAHRECFRQTHRKCFFRSCRWQKPTE